MNTANMTLTSGSLVALGLAFAMTFHADQSRAGKPEVLDQVIVTFLGTEVGDTSPSHEVKRSSKRGKVQVAIVVRDMTLSVPVAMDNLPGGETCFAGDAAASGQLTLYDDGTADFDLYAVFSTVEGELQSYNFFLEGAEAAHVIDLGADPVTGVVTFVTMDVGTEGRGKKPKSCRGTIELDGTDLVIEAVE